MNEDVIGAATRIMLEIRDEAERSDEAYAALAADPAAFLARHGLILQAPSDVEIHRAATGAVFIGIDLRALTLDGAAVEAAPVETSVDPHERHFTDCYFNPGGQG